MKKIKNNPNKQLGSKESAKFKKLIDLLEGQMDRMKALLLQSDQSDAWKELQDKLEKELENN